MQLALAVQWEMISQKLPDAAENVRKEIRDMIPETTTLPNQPAATLASVIEEDKLNGYTSYGGELLAAKVAQLQKKMNIGGVWLIVFSFSAIN